MHHIDHFFFQVAFYFNMLLSKAFVSFFLLSGVTDGLPLPFRAFQKRNAVIATTSEVAHVDTVTDINIVTITATSCPEAAVSSSSAPSSISSAESEVLAVKYMKDTTTSKTVSANNEVTSTESVVSVIISNPDATNTPDDGLVHIVNVVSHPGALFRATSVDDPITTTYSSVGVSTTASATQDVASNYVVVSSTGNVITYATSAASSTLSNGSISTFVTSSIVSVISAASNIASSTHPSVTQDVASNYVVVSSTGNVITYATSAASSTLSNGSISKFVTSSIVSVISAASNVASPTSSSASEPAETTIAVEGNSVSSVGTFSSTASSPVYSSAIIFASEQSSGSVASTLSSAEMQSTTLQTSTIETNTFSEVSTQNITPESAPTKSSTNEISTNESSTSDSSLYEPSATLESEATSSTTNAATSTSISTTESSSTSVGYVTGHPVTIVYSPYTNDSGCKSYDTVYADLTLIKSKQISEIRVYGNDCNYLTTVLPIAAELGLKVNQGFWISSDGVDSIDSAVTDLISSATSNSSGFDWSLFSFITIGNEAIISNYCTVDELISKIASVKSQLKDAGYNGLVTTSEPPVTFEDNPTLCTDSEIDFVGINPHSYFDVYASANTSGSFVKGQIEIVEGVCPDMDIFVTETGYPSAGKTNGDNVPSPLNQKIAIQNIFDVVGTNVTILTTFNDYWKQPGDYGIEQSFGIIQLLQ